MRLSAILIAFIPVGQGTLTVPLSPDAWVQTLSHVVNGGAALILAVLFALLCLFTWNLLKKYNALSDEYRATVKDDGQATLSAQLALTREMMNRDVEARETTAAAIDAVEAVARTNADLAQSVHAAIDESKAGLASLNQLDRRVEGMPAKLDALLFKLDSALTKLESNANKLDQLDRRVDALGRPGPR